MTDTDHFENVTIKLPKEEADRYGELSNTKSGTGRMILRTWMDMVEEHNLKEEPQEMQLAILYSYKNAIEKNIEMLKSQRDKLQDSIDDIEGEGDDELLLEVDLKLKRKHL